MPQSPADLPRKWSSTHGVCWSVCVCKCTSVLFRHMCKGEGVENQCWESYYFFSAYLLSSLPLQLSSQKTRLSIRSSILAQAKQCCLVAMVSIILPASFGLKDKALTIGRWVIFKEKGKERDLISTHICYFFFIVTRCLRLSLTLALWSLSHIPSVPEEKVSSTATPPLAFDV